MLSHDLVCGDKVSTVGRKSRLMQQNAPWDVRAGGQQVQADPCMASLDSIILSDLGRSWGRLQGGGF